MLPAILFVFGLYFVWDAYRSFRNGVSNEQWGFQRSRAEAPRFFWAVLMIELLLAAVAFALAAYISLH